MTIRVARPLLSHSWDYSNGVQRACFAAFACGIASIKAAPATKRFKFCPTGSALPICSDARREKVRKHTRKGIFAYFHAATVGALFILFNLQAQAAANGSGQSGPAQQPNVLIILSDDQGIGDVSCYGSEIPTPHIDSLARAGMKFECFYAEPTCTPARFALLAGQYPSRSQSNLNEPLMFLWPEHADRGIKPGETTFASLFQKQGYKTGLVGEWHLGHGPDMTPRDFGFDVFYGLKGGGFDYITKRYGIKADWYRNEEPIDEPGYVTDLITAEAVRFIDSQSEDQPFLLYLAYTAPHYGKGYDPLAKDGVVNIMQPKQDHIKRFMSIKDPVRRSYAAMVSPMDDGIGEVLKKLRQKGFDDSTLVIFLSDNGGDPLYGGNNLHLRGEKATMFEGGIRVPCIMRWPGQIKPGTTSDQMASILDLFPTLCGLANISTGGLHLDGIDLSETMLQGRQIQRDLFWSPLVWVGVDEPWVQAAAYRQGPWKYMNTGKGEELLFNIDQDPRETMNLAAKEPERLKRLKAKHTAIMKTFPQHK